MRGRQLLYPFDHASQAVTSLRRYVLLNVQPFKDLLNIKVKNLSRCAT